VSQRVGSYEVVRILARGGMAVVYLAHQPTLGRAVALKRLQIDSADPTVAQRFVREARLAAGLGHPNVVTLFDFFQDDGVPYIAMEYVGGGSLRRLVGRLGLPEVFGVLEGILAGLEHAEARGIAHRDLKPENVLITQGGAIKIADFGIARAYNALTQSLTSTGATIGTPAYMAPEQVTDEPLGPYTDLYAVGVIAYELLAGRPPFDPEAGPMAVLYGQVHKRPPPLTERAPQVPVAVCEWVECLLAKAPSDRPRSAADAREALEELAVAELGPYWRRRAAVTPAPDPVPTLVVAHDRRALRPPTAETRVVPRRRGRRRIALAAAALAVAGIVTAVALVGLDSTPPARPAGTGAKKPVRTAAATPFDFDGDRKAELVLGMPGSGRSNAGAVLMRSGDAAEVITPATAHIKGPYSGRENFGKSVASGDFDHDGHADLAVSVPGRGLVVVFHNSSEGLRGGRIDRIHPSRTRPFEARSGRFGNRMLSADLNGDGFDDLALGAPGADTGRVGSGVIYVLFGGRHGLAHDPQPVFRPTDALVNFGTALRGGDINGDGYADLVEGAPDDVLSGRAGHATYCAGSRTGPHRCHLLPGPVSSGTSALAVADVDGDHYDDIIQGDAVVEYAAVERGAALGGEVRVWLGRRHGPTGDPIVISQQTHNVPGGDDLGDEFGAAVGAGDLDRDGYADIVVGAPGEDEASGAVTVIRGSGTGVAATGHARFDKAAFGGIPGDPVAGEQLGWAVAVTDVAGNKRLDVAVDAHGAVRLADAVFVIKGGTGNFAPGETRIWWPLRGAVKLKNPNIERIRFGREAGA
jgi:tRNA A-37 threonylcarbamoyl transferase component Bud32